MITPLLLSVAVMAFGFGAFYLTPSVNLPDPGKKRRMRRKGWGLLGCFVVGVLIAGLWWPVGVGVWGW